MSNVIFKGKLNYLPAGIDQHPLWQRHSTPFAECAHCGDSAEYLRHPWLHVWWICPTCKLLNMVLERDLERSSFVTIVPREWVPISGIPLLDVDEMVCDQLPTKGGE